MRLIDPIQMRYLWLFAGTLLQATGTSLYSQILSADENPDPVRIEVFLLTIGPGDAIWEQFGHNALVIQDSRDKTAIAYNWGIFDFGQHDFIMRLARGRMRYAMRGFPASALVESYRGQDRTVWSQKVNLTFDQKLKLLALIREMDTESNRYYRYDYYRDNCSTRIRDILDSVLDGEISSITKEQDAGVTYRWHTARLLQSNLPAYAGIQFVVGNIGDKPISIWDEMFLPLRLKEHLETVSNKSLLKGNTKLLEPPTLLVESSRGPSSEKWIGLLTRFLLLGVVFGGILLMLGWGASKGSAQSRWILIGLGAFWSTIMGALGTLLMLSWIFTDHVFWTLNENIFQANPISLVLAISLLGSFQKEESLTSLKLTRLVSFLAILGFIVQIFPGFDQMNGEMIALTLPVHLGLNLGIQWSRSANTV